MRVLDNITDKQLDGLIRMLAIAITVMAVGIAGFYVKERYVQNNVSIVDQAEDNLTDMIKKDPENIDNRITVANVFYTKGKYDDAIAQYNEALKINPNHVGAIFGLGISYAAKSQDDKALGYFEAITRLAPPENTNTEDSRMNEVYYQIGRIYMKSGRADDALAAFRQAWVKDPLDADSVRLIGDILLQKGQMDDAENAYQKALTYVPDFAEAYDGLRKVYVQKGDKIQADWAAGMMAMSKQDYDGAISQLTSVVKAKPDYASAYFGLGRSYEYKNDKTKAYEAYKKAAELDPDGQRIAANAASKLEILVH